MLIAKANVQAVRGALQRWSNERSEAPGPHAEQRVDDVLAFFDRPGTSNGPTEAINSRLEPLRGVALSFRNLTHYTARSLLKAGGFKTQLHRQLGRAPIPLDRLAIMNPAQAARTAPIPGVTLAPFEDDDLAELVVLQRCCWVQEAVANASLDIPPLHETSAEVLTWARAWTTLTVRHGPRERLVAAVRGRREGAEWQIGRLMVAPDLAGRGLGRWLLHVIEDQAPDDVERFALFTGSKSHRNITTYQRAGYHLVDPPNSIPTEQSHSLVFMEKQRDASSVTTSKPTNTLPE